MISVNSSDQAPARSVSRCIISNCPTRTSSLCSINSCGSSAYSKWLAQKDGEALAKKLSELKITKAKQLEKNRLDQKKDEEKKERIKQWFNRKIVENSRKTMHEESDNLKTEKNTSNSSESVNKWLQIKEEQRKMKQKEAEIREALEKRSHMIKKAKSEASYEEWMRNLADREPLEIARNGYQIFGPKPPDVAKAEWVSSFPTEDSTESLYSLHSSLSISTLGRFNSEQEFTGQVLPKLDLRYKIHPCDDCDSQRTFILTPTNKGMQMKKKAPFR